MMIRPQSAERARKKKVRALDSVLRAALTENGAHWEIWHTVGRAEKMARNYACCIDLSWILIYISTSYWQLVFLILVHTEYQVNHQTHSVWVKVFNLVPNVQTLTGHVDAIRLAPTTTLHFDTVHKTKKSWMGHHGMPNYCMKIGLGTRWTLLTQNEQWRKPNE
jgi:hypothetical protein